MRTNISKSIYLCNYVGMYIGIYFKEIEVDEGKK